MKFPLLADLPEMFVHPLGSDAQPLLQPHSALDAASASPAAGLLGQCCSELPGLSTPLLAYRAAQAMLDGAQPPAGAPAPANLLHLDSRRPGAAMPPLHDPVSAALPLMWQQAVGLEMPAGPAPYLLALAPADLALNVARPSLMAQQGGGSGNGNGNGNGDHPPRRRIVSSRASRTSGAGATPSLQQASPAQALNNVLSVMKKAMSEFGDRQQAVSDAIEIYELASSGDFSRMQEWINFSTLIRGHIAGQNQTLGLRPTREEAHSVAQLIWHQALDALVAAQLHLRQVGQGVQQAAALQGDVVEAELVPMLRSLIDLRARCLDADVARASLLFELSLAPDDAALVQTRLALEDRQVSMRMDWRAAAGTVLAHLQELAAPAPSSGAAGLHRALRLVASEMHGPTPSFQEAVGHYEKCRREHVVSLNAWRGARAGDAADAPLDMLLQKLATDESRLLDAAQQTLACASRTTAARAVAPQPEAQLAAGYDAVRRAEVLSQETEAAWYVAHAQEQITLRRRDVALDAWHQTQRDPRLAAAAKRSLDDAEQALSTASTALASVEAMAQRMVQQASKIIERYHQVMPDQDERVIDAALVMGEVSSRRFRPVVEGASLVLGPARVRQIAQQCVSDLAAQSAARGSMLGRMLQVRLDQVLAPAAETAAGGLRAQQAMWASLAFASGSEHTFIPALQRWIQEGVTRKDLEKACTMIAGRIAALNSEYNRPKAPAAQRLEASDRQRVPRPRQSEEERLAWRLQNWLTQAWASRKDIQH